MSRACPSHADLGTGGDAVRDATRADWRHGLSADRADATQMSRAEGRGQPRIGFSKTTWKNPRSRSTFG
jgi:hypothetical protein